MAVKRAQRRALLAGRMIAAVFIVLLGVAGGTVWLVFDNARSARNHLLRSYDQRMVTQELLSTLQAAEVGARGFLLTRDPRYLPPYEDAVVRIPAALDAVTGRTSMQNTGQRALLADLERSVEDELATLGETVRLARAGDFAQALARVRSGAGEGAMNEIGRALSELERAERTRIDQRLAAFERASDLTLLGPLLVASLLLALLMAAGLLLREAFRSVVDAEARADATAEQLRVSLDSLSQGISVFDADSRLAAWNECFVELFSVPETLLRIGTPYGAFVRHDWTDEENDFLETPAQVAAAPPESTERSKPIVYERTRADGRTFELRRTPLPAGGFVITYTDVSARHATEKQLRQSQRMDAVGQLTGGVAHDFNNLLTIIVGNLELVRARVADAGVVRALELAVTAADRGAKLTRQLLAFARRQPLEPEPINVNRLLTDLAEFFQRSLGEPIEVEVVTAAGVWTVMADPSQLENALFNLALNGRDAMPRGGKLIIEAANTMLDEAYARSHAEVQPGPYVMLAVTDTGSGMSADVTARAFEPFFSTKPQGKGSGLGLSQVFGFVKQSGGHVKLYSEVGHGTTVKLYLPKTTRTPAQQAVAPEEICGGRETVLVVEDDEDVRRTAVLMLRELGYPCIEAMDGKQALAILREGDAEIDVLFTDVMLPGGMLGRELAERAKSLMPRIRVLFTSGYTQNVIVHGGRVDEDVVFLGKPYKKSELGRKLRQILEKTNDTPSAAPKASPVAAFDAGSAPASIISAPAPAPGKAGRSVSPKSILVVEDEPLVLWLALDLIRECGHDPIQAKNAAEALALLDGGRAPVDALMTDLELPDMRGDALVARAREKTPGLPVIVASGYGEDRTGPLAGVERLVFLAKPYDASSLRAALAAAGIACPERT